MTLDIETLLKQAHSPIRNFFVPGLTRWTIGGVHESGSVHLFHAARGPIDWVTPHSHRFNTQFLVLEGAMTNRRWYRSTTGDQFMHTEMLYDPVAKTFTRALTDEGRYSYNTDVFSQGHGGSIDMQDIHSVLFEKGSYVLFFEGPMLREENEILEPYAEGQHIRTFDPQPWMFK